VQPKKPSRYHRLERELPKYHVDDETGHLWAISYADFLMVLLSFFILFFSVNSRDKNSIINIISKARDKGYTGSGNGSNGVVAAGSLAGVSTDSIVESVNGRLKDIKWEVNAKEKSVTFLLSDEIFSRGGTDMNKKGRLDLAELLAVLKPFADKVDIIFVGHTDPRPFRAQASAFIENNFDLSALRAAQAVKLAMTQGLPKDSLFTHGSADNTRATKSLSIVVVQKGEGRI
jgi:flagellar motor protein MotB